MRSVHRYPSPLVGVLGAALLIGCGSDNQTQGAVRSDASAAAQGVPAPEAGHVTIAEPENGAALEERTGRTTAVEVAGRSAPGFRVAVVAACQPVACEQQVVSDAEGRWHTTLRFRPTSTQRRLTISAGPADASAGGAVNLVVLRLTGPQVRPRRQPAPIATKKKRKAEASSPTTVTPDTTPAAAAQIPEPTPRARPSRVLLVGDSLAEGIAGLLPGLLPGRTVSVDAKTSRPLATGMQIARTAPRGTVLAVSLFTNDDPSGTGRLEAAVRESARLAGPGSCAVWATIVRPLVSGTSYAAANAKLEALAQDPSLRGSLRIVPWARAVAERPEWLSADGVHATPSGYRGRAELYAEAIDSC